MDNQTKEILYGIHPVLEAIKTERRKIYNLYIAKEKHFNRLEEIISFANKLKIPILNIAKSELTKLTGTDKHQGIGAMVNGYPFVEISYLFSICEMNMNHAFLLLLDHIVDPHNLGALIRTSVCVGVHGIIIPKDRSAYPSPAVSKASAGALEHSRIAQVPNIVSVIKELKHKGIWIAGLDPSASQSIFSSDLSGSLALVIGGEEKGIRPLIKTNCDFLVSIPQQGSINSLNASVAGAIAMYEVFRQRNFIKVSTPKFHG